MGPVPDLADILGDILFFFSLCFLDLLDSIFSRFHISRNLAWVRLDPGFNGLGLGRAGLGPVGPSGGPPQI